jgi:two-component system cell cycle sensor histidine kinase/response regulator CckA
MHKPMQREATDKQLQFYSSEGRKTDQALSASELSWQMIDEMLCGIIQVSPDGSIVRANTVAQDILGLSFDDLFKRSVVYETFFEDGRACPVKDHPVFKCLTTQQPQAATTIGVRRRDGRIAWVIFRAFPLADPVTGLVIGAVATFLDISERKRMEEALRESEQRYQSLYCSMNEGVALHEILYNEAGLPFDYLILDVNPAYESILSLKREEAVGRKASELYSTDAPPYLEIYSKVVATGEPVSFQATFEPLHKSFSVSAFSPGKDKFATVLEDITERLRLESELFQSQKLEGIGRLAGGVAHDFNNLLTAINGYSQSLLNQLDPGNPMRPKLEQIKKAGERAASLTHQLLAFSRKQVLQPRVLDLNSLVANMDKMLRRLIGEDIELVTLFGMALGQVKADPTQIEQVLLNLVVNARDAMPLGGKIVIETANVELDETYAHRHIAVAPGRYVMLAVWDSGSGMDAATLKHLFEPFYTTKERGKGTGLGLSTVYGIVKQSGGSIWVYSELNQGTTFKIYLPRVDQPLELVKTEPTPATVARGSETILLVEDEEVVRSYIRAILQDHGYKVLVAQDGSEALRIALQHNGPIHLLLTDVVMPQMSGRLLVQRLSPLRPAMKVFYMSGYTEGAIVHHGVLEPGAAFIEKPFTIESLARKVREILDATE